MKSHRPFLSCGLGVLLALTTLAVVPAFGQSALGDFVWEDLNRNGVQDAGEPGIPGVLVRLYDCANNLLANTNTDASGRYLYGNLAPGAYKVGFTSPAGYLFTLPDVGDDARDSDANATTGFTACYTLGSGQTNLTVDAGLYRPAALGDFVWEDLNRNGVLEAGEPSLSNVMVRLYDCATNLLATTNTDANGVYLFGNLPPGAYLVRFTPPASYAFTLPNASNDAQDSDANATTGFTACYTLLSGQTNRTVDAGLYRPAILGDFAWEDLNRNGVQDAGEPGVSNVMVRLLDCAGNVLAAANTDAGGHYLFAGLAPGFYKVGFVPPPGLAFTLPDAGNDALDSDANATTGFTACYLLLSGQANLTVDAGLIRIRPRLTGASLLGNGAFQFTFTNTTATAFTVLATTNAAAPASDWQVLGLPMPLGGGLYQFTDPGATNAPRRFYQLRSP